MAGDDAAGDVERAAVIVAEDADGALIVGGEAEVAAFVAQWEADGVEVSQRAVLTAADRAAALSLAADAGAVGATAARYLRMHQLSEGGGQVVLRLWVQDSNGRIVSNKAINPALLTGQPAVLLGLLALRTAVADSAERVLDAVDRVQDTADEVLRLAGADRAGDVVGHHRLLRRLVASVDAGPELSRTDWSTVAGLGPALEVGVERLRNYARRLVADLPPGLKADERAERLDRVVRTGRLGEVMRLLVVAEQSLYLWQRLRIEEIRSREPDLLAIAVEQAHTTLAEHLHADGELVASLRTALDAYGGLRASEFHRKISGRRLRAHLEALRLDVDDFVTARGLQIEGWQPLVAPTARDALHAAATVAVGAGRSVRAAGSRTVDGGLAAVARAGGAVQAGAEWLRSRRPASDDRRADEGEEQR